MNKFRFSMLFAVALTIVSLALPLSAASTRNPVNGTPGITATQALAPSTANVQIEPVGPPPDNDDFVALNPVGPPPDNDD